MSRVSLSAKFDVRYHIVKFVKLFGREGNRKCCMPCKTNFFTFKQRFMFTRLRVEHREENIVWEKLPLTCHHLHLIFSFLTIHKDAKLWVTKYSTSLNFWSDPSSCSLNETSQHLSVLLSVSSKNYTHF